MEIHPVCFSKELNVMEGTGQNLSQWSMPLCPLPQRTHGDAF